MTNADFLLLASLDDFFFPFLVFAASRRYEGASWLRKMVGVVAAKDLPAEPSEEEFRLGLRSGIILCNALNKVQPGAVPKVNLVSIFSFGLDINCFSSFFIFIFLVMI